MKEKIVLPPEVYDFVYFIGTIWGGFSGEGHSNAIEDNAGCFYNTLHYLDWRTENLFCKDWSVEQNDVLVRSWQQEKPSRKGKPMPVDLYFERAGFVRGVETND